MLLESAVTNIIEERNNVDDENKQEKNGLGVQSSVRDITTGRTN